MLASAMISGNSSTLACIGAPGMGKSTVALIAVRSSHVAEHFQKHRYWIPCSSITNLTHTAFLDLLDAGLGLQSNVADSEGTSSTNDRLSFTVSNLRNRLVNQLLVLDDFDGVWSLDGEFARSTLDLLSSIPNITVLVTIQGWMTAPPVDWFLRLEPLSLQSSLKLFLSTYPITGSTEVLKELLKRVGFVPQSIVILAHVAYKNDVGLDVLLRLVDQGEDQLLDYKAEGMKTMTESFNLSPARGDLNALSVLRIMSVLPGGILREHIHTYAPHLTSEAIDSTCDALSNLSLAQHGPDGRLVLLPSIRAYATKYAQLDTSSRDALFTQLISLVDLSKGRICPGEPNFLSSVRRFESDKANTESILSSGLDARCTVAIEAAIAYSKPLCAMKPSLSIALKAVSLARDQNDMALLARSLQSLGEIYYALESSFGNALNTLAEASDLFQQLGDDRSHAECQILWYEISHRGAPQKPLDGFRRAVSLSKSFTDRAGRLCHAHSLLKILNFTSPSEQSRLLAHAEGIFEELQDKHGTALCRMRKVIANEDLEDLSTTLRDLGDFVGVAKCQWKVAARAIHYSDMKLIVPPQWRDHLQRMLEREDLAHAIKALRKALEIYLLLDHRLDAAFCRFALGQLVSDLEAVPLYEKAIAQFNLSAFTFHRERCTLDLCIKLARMGRYSDAIPMLEYLQHRITYVGKPYVLRCKELLTECYCKLGEHRPAVKTLQGLLESNTGKSNIVFQLGDSKYNSQDVVLALADSEEKVDLLAAYEAVIGAQWNMLQREMEDNNENEEDKQDEDEED